MIREAIKTQMKMQGINQLEMIDKIPAKLTPSQLSNFLAGKSSLNIQILDFMLEVLKIQLIKIL